MRIQPLGRLFGVDFHLGHVLLAIVILSCWGWFYLHLERSFIDGPAPAASPGP